MAVLKIARMGHPVLSRPAQAVADPTAPEVRRLVEDMLDTMADAGGTGLAAPQVHVPLRLVIFFVDRAQEDEDAEAVEDAAKEEHPSDQGGDHLAVPLTVLINPEIEVLDETLDVAVEGCLSLPGLLGKVPRHRRIRYRGLTLSGALFEREAEGFHARVVQHECDHLDGLLYPQRMTDLASLAFTSEMGLHYDEADALRRFRIEEDTL